MEVAMGSEVREEKGRDVISWAFTSRRVWKRWGRLAGRRLTSTQAFSTSVGGPREGAGDLFTWFPPLLVLHCQGSSVGSYFLTFPDCITCPFIGCRKPDPGPTVWFVFHIRNWRGAVV